MGLKSLLGGSKTESAKKRPPLRNESLREDPADEHKRIARRRLIGAVALLLLAIIILPLVLEDAPKPVSSDIALNIPSRDLAVRSNPEASPPPGAEDAAPEKVPSKGDAKGDVKGDAKAESQRKADAKVEAKAEPKAEPKSEAKSEPKAEPKSEPKAELKAESRPEPKAELKTEPKPVAKAEPKASETKASEPKAADAKSPEPKAGKHLNVVQANDPIASFANAKTTTPPQAAASNPPAGSGAAATPVGRSNHWVQIGAFGNEGKAREMASQLRGKGYPAVTEVVRGSNGGSSELYRVRVGPLETKESATRARDNLARSGFEGAVVQ